MANLEKIVEEQGPITFYQSFPLFSVLGIVDRILRLDAAKNRFVEQYFPRFSRHRIKQGVYQGWVLTYREKDEVEKEYIDSFIRISRVNSHQTIVELLNSEQNKIQESVILDKPLHLLRWYEISSAGMGVAAACYEFRHP